MAAEWDGLRCALYGLAFLPLLFALSWTLVEACLRPWLIAGRDIEHLADAVIAQHPDDPEEAAFVGEHAAWLRSAMVEQGKWRRVRKVIHRRLALRHPESPPPSAGEGARGAGGRGERRCPLAALDTNPPEGSLPSPDPR